jgi:hypothetical protein
VASDRQEDWRENLFQGLGRPVLLILWTLVVWGTIYGVALLVAVATDGPQATLRRVLSGRDVTGGLVNLASTAMAALAWLAALVTLARSLRKSARRTRSGSLNRASTANRSRPSDE